jgi:hypothetical protein
VSPYEAARPVLLIDSRYSICYPTVKNQFAIKQRRLKNGSEESFLLNTRLLLYSMCPVSGVKFGFSHAREENLTSSGTTLNSDILYGACALFSRKSLRES